MRLSMDIYEYVLYDALKVYTDTATGTKRTVRSGTFVLRTCAPATTFSRESKHRRRVHREGRPL